MTLAVLPVRRLELGLVLPEVKLKLICASKHEPDELTINTASMPPGLREAVADLPKNTCLVFKVRPRGTRVDWPWAWRVNRAGPKGAITTRTAFCPHRMRVPTTTGISVEIEVEDVVTPVRSSRAD